MESELQFPHWCPTQGCAFVVPALPPFLSPFLPGCTLQSLSPGITSKNKQPVWELMSQILCGGKNQVSTSSGVYLSCEGLLEISGWPDGIRTGCVSTYMPCHGLSHVCECVFMMCAEELSKKMCLPCVCRQSNSIKSKHHSHCIPYWTTIIMSACLTSDQSQ